MVLKLGSAVHIIDLPPDLSLSNFMLAFRRFLARRSMPSIIVSDYGSTFGAADVSIQNL